MKFCTFCRLGLNETHITKTQHFKILYGLTVLIFFACSICSKFYTNTQNLSKVMFERQNFRIMIIQEWQTDLQFCTDTLRMQMLQIQTVNGGAYRLDNRGDRDIPFLDIDEQK